MKVLEIKPVFFKDYSTKVTLGYQMHSCLSTDGRKPVIKPFKYYPGLSFQKCRNEIIRNRNILKVVFCPK